MNIEQKKINKERIQILIGKLEYFMDGGYTTQDTLRSLCQDAVREINQLQEKLEQYRKAEERKENAEYLIEAEGSEAKHIIGLLQAEEAGRLHIIPSNIDIRCSTGIEPKPLTPEELRGIMIDEDMVFR